MLTCTKHLQRSRGCWKGQTPKIYGLKDDLELHSSAQNSMP